MNTSMGAGSKVRVSVDMAGRTWLTSELPGGRKTRELARQGIDNARVRFNWGFHDGVADVLAARPARDVSDHYDCVYADGYERGAKAVASCESEGPVSSLLAWVAGNWVDDFTGWRP